jgi:hypothetical protein
VRSERKMFEKALSPLVPGLTAAVEEGGQVKCAGGSELLPSTGTGITLERVRELLDDE